MKILFLIITFLSSQAFAMNKGELIEAMAKDANLSKADSKRTLEAIEKTVVRSIRKGKSITIPGFGTFSTVCKVKERANITKCQTNFRLNKLRAVAVAPRYIDNFFKEMASIMISSANSKQYVCSGLDNDCDGIDDDCDGTDTASGVSPGVVAGVVVAAIANDKDTNCDDPNGGGTRATDHNSSRSNKTSSIMRIVGDGTDSCYKDGNLYKEVFDEEGRADAKNRCLTGLLTAIQVAGKNDPTLNTENLSVLVETGVDSFFDIFTEYLDEDSDGDTILDGISRKANLSKADAKRALDGFVSATATALKKGDRISLVGFGSFSISKRAARTGRNPQTGATIQIKAKKVAKFKAGKALADTVK